MADKKKRRIDPKNAIQWEIKPGEYIIPDYYDILGVTPDQFPEGDSFEEKQELALLLNTAYQQRMLSGEYCHADLGGDDHKFMLLVRAHSVLSDPYIRRYYDLHIAGGGGQDFTYAEDGTGDFGVDWDELGTWREGTTADTTGRGLFRAVYGDRESLGLVPAFYPTDEKHSYEWDFVIKDSPVEGAKLAISIVHDETEVLRLTSGQDLKDSLPFKIYICIPRAQLRFARGAEQEVVYEDGSVDEYKLRGTIHGAAYSDYNLLETTKLAEARAYIAPGGQLFQDMAAFRDGTLVKEQTVRDREELELKFVTKEEMNQKDSDAYRALLFKLQPKTKRNENAAQVLENLPERK
jgi:hypothetical protein